MSRLTGTYNYKNILASLSIASYFGLSLDQMKIGVENYTPENNRSQMINKKGHRILLDAYNANPSSMAAALLNFSKLASKNKMVILGDMFELGADSEKEHQEIAELALNYDFNEVYLIGKAFSVTRTKNAFTFSNFDSFKSAFKAARLKDSFILIKGSRGMSLERILDLF